MTIEDIAKGAFLASVAITAIMGACIFAVILWREINDLGDDPIGGFGDEDEPDEEGR